MRGRAILMLGLALVFASGAVVLVKNWMADRSAVVAKQEFSTITVVVAKTPLSFGAVIRKENLTAAPWPRNAVPKGAFNKIDEVVNDKNPRVVLRRIEANEPLTKSKISGFGGRASLSAVISRKMRATTIRVNDVNGVAGFILPGDNVDVMLTRDRVRDRNSARDLITDVLLQNIKVLAIDQDADEKKEKPSVAKAVTLEVTTLQAQKLVLAQKVGSLSLALRNLANANSEFVRTVSTADLRIGEVNKPVIKKIIMRSVKRPSPVNRLSSVKVVRGLKASEYRVHREGSGIGSPIRLTPRGLSAEKSDRRPNRTSNALDLSRDQGTVATPPPISLDRRRNVLNPNPVSVPPPILDTPAAVKIRYTGQTSKNAGGR